MKVPRFILDKVLLVAAAAVVAVAGFYTFYAASAYHLPRELPFAVWIGIGFIVAVWRTAAQMWRKRFFIPYFIAWTVIHTAVCVAVIRKSDLFTMLAVSVPELCVGFLITFCLFGVPGRKSG